MKFYRETNNAASLAEAASSAAGSLDLSVLIISYRTREHTLRCLRSIYQQTRQALFEVVVADNNSADGTVEAIRALFPAVRLVVLEANIGFGPAVNVAAALARGKYLVLLNPDTEVLDGALDRLLTFAQSHPGHGLYTGKTLRPDGELDPRSCWDAPSLWSLTCFGFGLSTLLPTSAVFNPESLGTWRRDSIREVRVITGCFCLLPRSVWDELGGFDPIYFMYGEDTDLSLRAGRLGYRPIFSPDPTIVHVGSASSTLEFDKGMLLMRGKATLIRRHWRGISQTWALAMLNAGVGLRGLLAGFGRGNGRQQVWSQLWRHRREWMGGYPAADREAAGGVGVG